MLKEERTSITILCPIILCKYLLGDQNLFSCFKILQLAHHQPNPARIDNSNWIYWIPEPKKTAVAVSLRQQVEYFEHSVLKTFI